MGHPHNGHHPVEPPDPTRDQVVPPEPHWLVKAFARLIAIVILVICAAGAIGCAVRVVQWAWPG